MADSTASLSASYFIMASFFVDMCVTFNTGYVDEETEKLIDDRKLIARRYIAFWFWIDIISTIPIDRIVQAYADVTRLDFIRMIRIFRLFRLLRFFHLLKKADRLEAFGANPQIINLGVLMVQLFFVAHIFACFWHYITLPQAAGSYPLNWVDHFGFSDHIIFDKYVASLYYVIITMLTIGYGDIHATNQLERMYAIMTMLTGGIVFGALVSKVTALIDKRNPQARAFKESMTEFKFFINENTLPKSMKQRCIVSLC